MNEKINELVASHQNAISQKDKQLSDYQKQVDTLQSVKNELTKMIEEQKAKNNVSESWSPNSLIHIHPPSRVFWVESHFDDFFLSL